MNATTLLALVGFTVGFLEKGEVVVNNPIAFVPKKEVGKGRIIIDMLRSGVNTSLPSPPVSLPRINEVLASLYPRAWMVETDFADHFYHFLVDPKDRKYLGLQRPHGDGQRPRRQRRVVAPCGRVLLLARRAARPRRAAKDACGGAADPSGRSRHPARHATGNPNGGEHRARHGAAGAAAARAAAQAAAQVARRRARRRRAAARRRGRRGRGDV